MECPKCKRQTPDGITACKVRGWRLAKERSECADNPNVGTHWYNLREKGKSPEPRKRP